MTPVQLRVKEYIIHPTQYQVRGTVNPIEILILNQMDGASPNTQIMTAFTIEPDVSDLAGQYSIAKSLESGHSTVLMNKLTGELIPHWVELDIRS